MRFLIIDFETRSRVDLKTAGTDKYCKDPSTEILCMVAKMSDDIRTWVWDATGQLSSSPLYDDVLDDFIRVAAKHVADGGLIAAHNARFDQQIWEYVAVGDHGFPEIPAESWYCTSAQARINALPANLDDATRALDARHRKNHAGAALIRQLCIPNDMGQFNNDVSLLTKLLVYCIDDVAATKDLLNSTRLMSPTEHDDWLANERINDRGIKIDRVLAEHATQYAAAEAAEIGRELSILTNNNVSKHTQNQRIKKWLLGRQVPDMVEQLMTVYVKGVKKHSLAKDIRTQILDRADSGEIDLPDDVYNVIAALDDGNKSSVAKYQRMLDRKEPDDRVRGSFMYAGAATIRYTSRGLQLHNFKRDCLSAADAESLRGMMSSGAQLSGHAVMDTLAKALRPTLIPDEGKAFIVGDWSSIENRALPWLANSYGGQMKLDLFKHIDADPDLPDMYVRAAEDAGGYDRQVGKVIELSLGFGGANGAFNSMARNYGVHLPDHQVTRIVKNWRRANQWAETFWNELERAARQAIQSPGLVTDAGRVKYVFNPDLIGGSLICELPCGQLLTYPATRLNTVDTEWGPKSEISALKANWSPAADAKEWPRYTLWRGLLAENVTQATCASLLRYVIRQFDDVVLHCHDEIALEVPIGDAYLWRDTLQHEMENGPAWAQGLPLNAPAKIMTRYGK